MKNRTIKFRVWQNELNKFLTPDEWVIDLNGNLRFIDFGCYDNGDNEVYPIVDKDLYTIQQYTGINDKNGKEICEGDILYGEVDTRVNFDDGIVAGDLYTFKGEVVYDLYNGFHVKNADFGLDSYETLEVVGNIFDIKG